MNNRQHRKTNDVSGLIATFEYNEFDDLISATYQQGKEVETIYRAPDCVSALYKQPNRRDREYDKADRLLEDPEYYYLQIKNLNP